MGQVHFVSDFGFSNCDLALIRDHGQEQADDLDQQAAAITHYGVTQNRLSLEIPVSPLAGATEAVFVETHPVPAAAATISFSNVSAN
jgi:hypothetical protein